jgi:hypothetical protein
LQLLDGFIEKFVLCKQDQNPETVIKITPKGEVDLVCKACGTVTRTDLAHKLTSFIVKNPPTQYVLDAIITVITRACASDWIAQLFYSNFTLVFNFLAYLIES